jgi:DNA polymerase-3 subunit delta
LSELRKLALYAEGRGTVGLADVLAVTADASSLANDDVVDAAFAGQVAGVESEFAKTRVAGTAPGTVLAAALRQLYWLHRARLAVEAGASLEAAIEGARPPIHFSRRRAVETALKAWTSARLEHAMGRLAQAAFDARYQSVLAEAIARRALIGLADVARRRA